MPGWSCFYPRWFQHSPNLPLIQVFILKKDGAPLTIVQCSASHAGLHGHCAPVILAAQREILHFVSRPTARYRAPVLRRPYITAVVMTAATWCQRLTARPLAGLCGRRSPCQTSVRKPLHLIVGHGNTLRNWSALLPFRVCAAQSSLLPCSFPPTLNG